MKTQKQLPNEFTFVCDEHSREQLEKLGVDYQGWGIESIPCEVKGFYFQIYNYEIIGGGFDGYEKQYDLSHAPLIYLSDYLDQEQPEVKWQEKTRGGYEYHIYEEFEGKIFGRVKSYDGKWYAIFWNLDGMHYRIDNSWDLLPINHELTTLQKELEEVRLKEKELLEKIEELKTK